MRIKNVIVITFGIIFIISVFIAGRFILGGDEDTWICSDGEWVAHGKPFRQKPDTPCPTRSLAPTIPHEAMTPEQVVDAFYAWYLQPKVDIFSIKDSPYLSAGFKLKVSGILLSSKRELNPVTLAYEKPVRATAGKPVIEGTIARLQLKEEFPKEVKYVFIALQKENGKWIITDIQPLTEQTQLSPVAMKTRKARVYFSNEKRSTGSTDCGLVYGVERTVGINDGYKEILQQLFMGPTMQDRNNGYTSMFSKATADAVISVKVIGTTAYVNLQDIRTIIPNASASCGSKEFFAQVGETLKHDRKITNVIYAINGDPEPFYEWMQIGCSKENNNCDTTPFK